MCERFPGRLPSEIWREKQRFPDGFLDEVVEAMAYAGAKRTYDGATNKKELPANPMTDLVRTVTFSLAEEAKAKKKT